MFVIFFKKNVRMWLWVMLIENYIWGMDKFEWIGEKVCIFFFMLRGWVYRKVIIKWFMEVDKL